MTSVVICDERRGARDWMYQVLAAAPAVAAIDSVDSGDELLAQVGRQPADVVAIGTQRAVPAGIETMRRLLVFHPEVAVILFGSADDVGAITAAVVCGAQAFLRWDVTQPEIVASLADVIGATPAYDPRPRPRPDSVELSQRELQVLRGISDGRGHADIAAALTLSRGAVKSHARRLYRKLGAADRAQAVAIGMRCGLLT